MTQLPEMTHDQIDDEQPSMLRYWGHIAGWSFILTFALIGLVLAAIATAHLVSGEGGGKDWYLIGGGLLVAAVLFVPLKRWMPDFTQGEPDTPRGRKMRRVLVALVLLGILISAPLIISDTASEEDITLFGNGPVPAMAAAAMIALWGLILPVMIVVTRRSSDEVARAAGEFGSMVGFQLFGWATPIWWIGWRGGFLPQPDVMIIFVATLLVATVATHWKRTHG